MNPRRESISQAVVPNATAAKSVVDEQSGDMSLLMKIKTVLKNLEWVRHCRTELRSWFRALLYGVSPVLLARYCFRVTTGRYPDLGNPQTFDEKLLWLMLYWHHPLKTGCTDKYAMRSYVKEHGLEAMLPGLLGVYTNSSEIDFDAFPERFVLKCTHGCGFNVFCKSKEKLDVKGTRRLLDRWMRVDFSKAYGEVQYALIRPRIICEEYLDDMTGALPHDYKVYCFHGRAHCTMVCSGRGVDGRGAKFDYYDRDWSVKLPYEEDTMRAGRIIPKPAAHDEMIQAAEILSRPFPFVRIDFYNIGGRAVIGEMTFTPNGCIDTALTEHAQHHLGRMIKLPERRLP